MERGKKTLEAGFGKGWVAPQGHFVFRGQQPHFSVVFADLSGVETLAPREMDWVNRWRAPAPSIADGTSGTGPAVERRCSTAQTPAARSRAPAQPPSTT